MRLRGVLDHGVFSGCFYCTHYTLKSVEVNLFCGAIHWHRTCADFNDNGRPLKKKVAKNVMSEAVTSN